MSPSPHARLPLGQSLTPPPTHLHHLLGEHALQLRLVADQLRPPVALLPRLQTDLLQLLQAQVLTRDGTLQPLLALAHANPVLHVLLLLDERPVVPAARRRHPERQVDEHVVLVLRVCERWVDEAGAMRIWVKSSTINMGEIIDHQYMGEIVDHQHPAGRCCCTRVTCQGAHLQAVEVQRPRRLARATLALALALPPQRGLVRLDVRALAQARRTSRRAKGAPAAASTRAGGPSPRRPRPARPVPPSPAAAAPAPRRRSPRRGTHGCDRPRSPCARAPRPAAAASRPPPVCGGRVKTPAEGGIGVGIGIGNEICVPWWSRWASRHLNRALPNQARRNAPSTPPMRGQIGGLDRGL